MIMSLTADCNTCKINFSFGFIRSLHFLKNVPQYLCPTASSISIDTILSNDPEISLQSHSLTSTK